MLKHVCAKYGIDVMKTAPILNFGRRSISADAADMLQGVKRDTPALIWVQWSEFAREPARRASVRTAVEVLTGIVELQIADGRKVLIEGKASDIPVRDEVFQGKRGLERLFWQSSHIFWCGLGIKRSQDGSKTLCGDHLVYAHPHWNSIACLCGRRTASHHPAAGSGYEQFCVSALGHFGFLAMSDRLEVSADWHQTQRQLRNKPAARQLVDTLGGRGPSEKPGDDKLISNVAEGTDTPQDEILLTQPDRATDKFLANAVSVAATLQKTTQRGPDPSEDAYQSAGAETLQTETQSGPVPSGALSGPVPSEGVSRTKSTASQCDSAYPTAAALKAKEVRKAREKILEENGGKEAVRLFRKKKPQEQQRHFDDCGSDCGPLEEHGMVAMLQDAQSTSHEQCKAAFRDDCYSDRAAMASMAYDLFDPAFELAYLLGSEVKDDDWWFRHTTPDAKYVPLTELHTYLSEPHRRAQLDVMEICGGMGGVSRICIRRRLRVGINHDLVTGVDLTSSRDVALLMQYIHHHQPAVIVMGPPCTSFGNWANLNKAINSETYAKSRWIGERIARVCAKIARIQVEAGRHYLIENPRGSQLFSLPEYEALMRTTAVTVVNFPQCSVGLLSPEGLPLLKWTTLWASCPELLEDFRGLFCKHTAHGELVGSRRTKLSQVWPIEMCRLIVCGICRVLTMRPGSRRKDEYASHLVQAYPAAASSGRGRGRPRKNPDADVVIFDCPACVRRRYQTDPDHTRNDCPPELCRYPHVAPVEWQCQACREHKNARDPTHTMVEGECRAPRQRREHGRARASGPVRDPAVPAGGDPESRNRHTGPNEVDVDAEPPRPALNPAFLPPPPAREEEDQPADPGGDDVEDNGDNGEGEEALARPRRRAVERQDAIAQAGEGAQEDWRMFDVQRAIITLRSINEAVRRRGLQRLHIRWYHATVKSMTQVLKAANAPARAVSEIPSVVQGCHVCRDWYRPPPKSVTTFRIVDAFNEEVQFDLMFYHSILHPDAVTKVIVHLVDACLRWSSTGIAASKEEVELVTVIGRIWIATFGNMKVLVLDEETGMRGRCASDWAESNGIQLKYKAPRQKAWIVERHNELLRQALHLTETQLKRDGVQVPFEQVLTTVTFMKNALTVINTSTPYQGLFGFQPAILPPLEGGYQGQVSNEGARPETNSRHQAQVREAAASNIVAASAKMRLARADASKTRGAVELKEMQPGGLVDIWFDPTNKDVPGWRGPAQIATVQENEAQVTVRYQGRTLDRRIQEVRHHIPYLVFFSCLHAELLGQWEHLRDYCEALPRGTAKVFGVVFAHNAKHTGWRLTQATQTDEGHRLLQCALVLASTGIHLEGCTTVRLSLGVSHLQPLTGFKQCELWFWRSVSRGGSAHEAPLMYEADPGDLDRPCEVKRLIGETQDVRSRDCDWQEYGVIQFWCAPDEDIEEIVTRFPEIVTVTPSTPPRRMEDVPVPETPSPMSADRTPSPMSTTQAPQPPPLPPAPPVPMSWDPGWNLPPWWQAYPAPMEQDTGGGLLPPPPPPPPPTTTIPWPSATQEPVDDPITPGPIEVIRRALSTPSSYTRSRTTPGGSTQSTPQAPIAASPATTVEYPPSPASTVEYPEVQPTTAPLQSTKRSVPSPEKGEPAVKLQKKGSPTGTGGASSSHVPWQGAQPGCGNAPGRGQDSSGCGDAPEGPELPLADSDDETDKEYPVLCEWQEELRGAAADEGSAFDESTSSSGHDYLEEMSRHTSEPTLMYLMEDGRNEDVPDSWLHTALGGPPRHVEIGFEDLMVRAHIGLGYFAGLEETVINVYEASTGEQTSVATKDFDLLTKEEQEAHKEKVAAAKLKEIKDLFDLGCFARMLRRQARNLVDTKWVHKWKLIDGLRAVKARLTMRGFRDREGYSLETFAGTASRWGQRFVNSAACLVDDMVLFSFDVSAAFAKGMTFKELSELTGDPLRCVQFELAAEDVLLLRRIPGFENFDPHKEVLNMVKPIYGLKDAPRAWRKKLHKILVEFGLTQMFADGQLYVSHDARTGKSTMSMPQHVPKPMRCLLSTHVDDLKGCARRVVAMELLAHLERCVGKCKSEWQKFTHVGVEHVQTPDGVYCHQETYASQLKPLDPSAWKGLPEESLADPKLAGLYVSLLGGVAWMAMTRVDVIVYIQSLQRHAHAPRIKDLKRLNVVARFIRRKRVGLWYANVRGPVKLMCFSDAAFKALVEESSGLALRGCSVLLVQDDQEGKPGSLSGSCHLVDYTCRRQRRVVRSTFSAELNGAVDSIEGVMLVQMGYHQLLNGTSEDATALAKALDAGKLTPPIDVATDARAVFDAVRAADVCEPAESSLKLHLISIRDMVRRGLVRLFFWTDTRDMLADGLTKGGVNRTALVRASEYGQYKAEHEVLAVRA